MVTVNSSNEYSPGPPSSSTSCAKSPSAKWTTVSVAVVAAPGPVARMHRRGAYHEAEEVVVRRTAAIRGARPADGEVATVGGVTQCRIGGAERHARVVDLDGGDAGQQRWEHRHEIADGCFEQVEHVAADGEVAVVLHFEHVEQPPAASGTRPPAVTSL